MTVNVSDFILEEGEELTKLNKDRTAYWCTHCDQWIKGKVRPCTKESTKA